MAMGADVTGHVRAGRAEVDSPEDVTAWLQSPAYAPAVFQGQDLRPHDDALAARDLHGCSFLGCRLGHRAADVAVQAGCLVLPAIDGLPFDPFRARLYTPAELYDGYDPDRPDSDEGYLDRVVYRSVRDPRTRDELPVDVDVELMRRLHDAAVAEALGDLLDEGAKARCVAIMGGHDEPRGTADYERVVRLALALAARGRIIATGGGPGLMEAANLGAYLNGFDDAASLLPNVLARLADGPRYSDPTWLEAGYRAWRWLGTPARPEESMSIGIPTWFYGHEPPNLFATHVAKYFENSVREEGLLAVAYGGVIFARGNAGTVQEVFQDACQNYYKTYGKRASPMVLLGAGYWTGEPDVEGSKPLVPLLRALAGEKGFEPQLLLTDDPAEIVAFLAPR